MIRTFLTIILGGTVVFGSKALLKGVLTTLTLFSLFAGPSALAKRNDHSHGGRGTPNNRPLPRPIRDYSDSTSVSNLTNDADFIRAIQDRRNVNFVEGGGVTVIQILPEDNHGLPHQKWVVQLSNGSRMTAVYNVDMGQKIPLKVGIKMALGGEFKMTNIGPLIHWLHYDPRQRRPDGFVIVNGVKYGAKN